MIEVIKYIDKGLIPEDVLILYLHHLWVSGPTDTTATPLELIRTVIRNRGYGTVWNLVDELLGRIINEKED